MSKEGREKIRKIKNEGIKSIEALIKLHEKKAARAKDFKDMVATAKHTKKILKLEKRLDDRKKISADC